MKREKKRKNSKKDVFDVPIKNKIKSYRSTKRKIKKYIPRESKMFINTKELTGKRVNTDDIKKKEFYLQGFYDIYNEWNFALFRAKEELRQLKGGVSSQIKSIEDAPKRIEELKQILTIRKNLLKKEEESSGYLNRTRTELLEKIRKRMEEDNVKKEVRMKIEDYIDQDYNLDRLKKFINRLERNIESELTYQEDSRNIIVIDSHKIEELEEFIQELEPKVKSLRDKLEVESKKLKKERNLNLNKLFNKE
ncbi:MAG: hypothetical protein ACFE75_08855 [Candidatus Hodarchaeota archaeon]